MRLKTIGTGLKPMKTPKMPKLLKDPSGGDFTFMSKPPTIRKAKSLFNPVKFTGKF